MRFAKGHGTENDFVILLDPDGRDGLTTDLAARLCDRRAGLGADGVLRVIRAEAMAHDDTPAQWFMDYRNANGAAVEMCGNGIRVFARYLVEHGLAQGPEFPVATRSGTKLVRLDPGGDVSVDMGPVTTSGPGTAVLNGQRYQGLRVSVGNPHLACLVDDELAKFDLTTTPGLDPGDFPDGGNVELVRVTGPAAVSMRVHERGSGETRSCGTGAVAAAVAAQHTAGQATGCWQVTVPGGQLTVTLDSTTSWLTGPAVIVAEGQLDGNWLAASS